MTEYKIAVVNSSSFGQVFTEHWTQLEAIGTVDRFMVEPNIPGPELAEKLKGYNVIISSVTPFFKKDFFENKDELLLISRHGIGYNNIDLEAAKEHGTKVTIVPPLVERNAVAENAIANLFSLIRRATPSSERIKADHYEDRAEFMGHEFTGKTYGVIGCGNIGSRVAEIFQYFAAKVVVCDPDPHAREGWFEDNPKIERVSLDELLAQSDCISLNASLNEEDTHMINADALKKAKDGVYFVNHARGALIDEKAMLAAVESGKVSGYAADTMEVEPVRANHPFLQNDRFLITPHTSAYTYECLHGMGEKCVADVKNLVAGKKLGRELTSTL
ncbi:D-isomer specific 2-hydroxyacid dehydrogenase family protein [Paucilactobacillus suebicus]|uniref:Phosphoglycerate dehydrogenase n=1 Tax=Paucilactobacillus suebicus DSM 5007 = KCTC 3549 TaxID=1423807 RepID=A0A0R1W3G2_9LACO|nr:D-isomer specific 2-hydroxyacid dehydrogenase family protein [Paucilactobacillus suebicus]KRM12141.1 phosphoglycerate dehydrogenase [Paucilactobacillus suebicus DSM 5007 = KCTC 3549]